MISSVPLCLRGEDFCRGNAQSRRTIVELATDDFLRHLRERNASPHTIKAYTGDLDAFSAYIGSRD